VREETMGKNITLFLSTSPYFSENALSTIKIAAAALRKGHGVRVIASADGVYCFLKKQKAKEIMLADIVLLQNGTYFLREQALEDQVLSGRPMCSKTTEG
jgi:sulfur relay (sulfurtransferase) complex TusBCD TusD component (DsrE family)